MSWAVNPELDLYVCSPVPYIPSVKDEVTWRCYSTVVSFLHHSHPPDVGGSLCRPILLSGRCCTIRELPRSSV